MSAAVISAMENAWRGIQDRYSAYRLALPGAPAFHCQPNICDAHCCRAFTVNLGEPEVDRMRTSSGLRAAAFLETDNGEPLALPMAQPYILARDDDHCRLLTPTRGCGQYAGRPDACRLYPHFLLFINKESSRPVHGALDAIRAAFTAFESGQDTDELLPLLLRHVECPGFTGPPISEIEWRTLCRETFVLQYPL